MECWYTYLILPCDPTVMIVSLFVFQAKIFFRNGSGKSEAWARAGQAELTMAELLGQVRF